MHRTMATELAGRAGESVRVAGWLHRSRELANVTFLVVRDATGLAQVVSTDPAHRGLAAETVLEVTGLATANPRAPGGVEITQPQLRPLSEPPAAVPFDLFRPKLTAGLAAQLDHAPVALRHPSRRRSFALAAASVAGFRRTLDARRFVEIHTPKIVGSATESGANVFGLDYFGRRAYLAQSPQFYKQMLVGVFERVYEVGPVFRAEPHDTTRHLAQYTSLDAELGFIADHRDVMAVVRDVVAGMIEAAGERVDGPLPTVPAEIPAVHFAEAMEMISRDTGVDSRDEPDLAPAHERWLGRWAQREHGSEFVFVTGYPMAKRPFYTQPEPGRPRWSASFDLLFGGVELATGGQRLHRESDYRAALADRGLDPEPYEGYLQTFGAGMPPHGGFAIGLERWTARLTGAANVRETTLFPRDLHRLSP